MRLSVSMIRLLFAAYPALVLTSALIAGASARFEDRSRSEFHPPDPFCTEEMDDSQLAPACAESLTFQEIQ